MKCRIIIVYIFFGFNFLLYGSNESLRKGKLGTLEDLLTAAELLGELNPVEEFGPAQSSIDPVILKNTELNNVGPVNKKRVRFEEALDTPFVPNKISNTSNSATLVETHPKPGESENYDIIKLIVDKPTELDFFQTLKKKAEDEVMMRPINYMKSQAQAYVYAINKKDSYGWTLLRAAVETKNDIIIEKLLRYGAYTYILDDDGITPLQVALNMKQKLPDNVMKMLTKITNTQAVEVWENAVNALEWNHGLPPEHSFWDWQLIAKTPGIMYHENDKHRTLLHYAAKKNRAQAASLLLSNMDDSRRKEFIDRPEITGLTALDIAIHNGSVQVADLLLKNDARINYARLDQLLSNYKNHTHHPMLRLIANSPNFINSIDDNGQTLLHYAAEENIDQPVYFQLVSLLLSNMDDIKRKEFINIEDNMGKTALDIAIENHSLEVANLLANNGAYINHKKLYNKGLHATRAPKNGIMQTFIKDIN